MSKLNLLGSGMLYKTGQHYPNQYLFIYLRDTVDSVGIIPKRLPFTTSNTIVRTFRHAISLDERRAKFKANLWNRPTEAEQQLGKLSPAPPPPSKPANSALKGYDSYEDAMDRLKGKDRDENEKSLAGGIDLINENLKKIIHNQKENTDDKLMNKFERIYSEQNEQTTDVEEVWFAGCHCGEHKFLDYFLVYVNSL